MSNDFRGARPVVWPTISSNQSIKHLYSAVIMSRTNHSCASITNSFTNSGSATVTGLKIRKTIWLWDANRR